MLARLAKGATSRRKALRARIGHAGGHRDPDHEFVAQLHRARQAEIQAHRLACDVRTLVHWLRHDVLALAGPDLATRRELFDFLVAEFAAREPEDTWRIRPVRVALQNQRNDLLAFAGQLDAKLADVARTLSVPDPLVREALVLRRLPTTRPLTGRGGTGSGHKQGASSTPWLLPSARPWRTPRAAARWSRT